MMHAMFLKSKTTAPIPTAPALLSSPSLGARLGPGDIPLANALESFTNQVDYLSDQSSEADESEDVSEELHTMYGKQMPTAPPCKRKKLDVPYVECRKLHRMQQVEERVQGLVDLRKLLNSGKTTFIGGERGLQARRTHAMESHLKMVVHNKRP